MKTLQHKVFRGLSGFQTKVYGYLLPQACGHPTVFVTQSEMFSGKRTLQDAAGVNVFAHLS